MMSSLKVDNAVIIVTIAAAIQQAGTKAQALRWLPDICAGTVRMGLGVISNIVVGVTDADTCALPLRDDLVIVDRSRLSLDTAGQLDPGIGAAALIAPVEDSRDVIVGGALVAARVFPYLAAAAAAGGINATLEGVVAYALVRGQFGRPIGSFQAVKHHCAEMLVDAELAGAVAWDAGRSAARSGPEADLSAAIAAGLAVPAYLRAAEMAIQVYGGIGYTWEHDAHLDLRRALALAALLDCPQRQNQAVVELWRAEVDTSSAVALPPGAEACRPAARAFVKALGSVPPARRQVDFARSGYLVPHWPPPYGRGATAAEQLAIDEELAAVERPSLGLGEWVIPTILQHGTDTQKERLIWPSLEGQLRWCQLFSEPGAGSDAASVQTGGIPVEGGWRVTGQKVWTSDARACQRGLATIRTNSDAPKHQGITAMVIDMAAPGVDIRPLRDITGEALFNEAFLDDVFVPDDDVIGEVDGGWRVARSTLGNERVSIAAGSETMEAGELLPLLDAHRFRGGGLEAEVATLLIEGHALKQLNLRQAERAVITKEPGIEASLAKLFGAEHAQRVARLGARLIGSTMFSDDAADVVHDFLYSKCLTIGGGTSEVLRNQIAERILGLPKDNA